MINLLILLLHFAGQGDLETQLLLLETYRNRFLFNIRNITKQDNCNGQNKAELVRPLKIVTVKIRGRFTPNRDSRKETQAQTWPPDFANATPKLYPQDLPLRRGNDN